MVVQNRTWELPPDVAPRNVDVHLKDEDSQLVEITWLPPKTTNGRITGTFWTVTLYFRNRLVFLYISCHFFFPFFSRLCGVVYGRQKPDGRSLASSGCQRRQSFLDYLRFKAIYGVLFQSPGQK